MLASFFLPSHLSFKNMYIYLYNSRYGQNSNYYSPVYLYNNYTCTCTIGSLSHVHTCTYMYIHVHVLTVSLCVFVMVILKEREFSESTTPSNPWSRCMEHTQTQTQTHHYHHMIMIDMHIYIHVHLHVKHITLHKGQLQKLNSNTCSTLYTYQGQVERDGEVVLFGTHVHQNSEYISEVSPESQHH